ncbi:DUF493 family protein [Salinispirillum sp. LH 10-3-1]|uniref:UPF0250 protein NFC81_04275 n=1 Tax=Salinispirillum sp. LH 10-3-1 TaxID=2952525 RepID=A0AB38YI32_9GAMM
MNEQDAPKIEFPCKNYPVKVVGEEGEGFKESVFAVFEHLGIEHSTTRIREMPSKNGRFVALTVPITAESVEQLATLNTELRKLTAVKMVI